MSLFFKRPWINQPQQYTQPDYSNSLLNSAELIVLVNGATPNTGTKVPTTKNGVVSSLGSTKGIGIYSGLATGDLSAVIPAIGGSARVDFWVGYWSGGANAIRANQYLFGDYTGSAGSGLTVRHNDSLGGRWGVFDGTALVDSGESLSIGFHTFVISREISGAAKVYLDGVFKFNITSLTGGTASWAIGSVGTNTYGTFGTESQTLLAGRIRYKTWSAAQVLSFHRNPWQLLAPLPRKIWVPSSGVSSVTGTLTTTLLNDALAASGTTTVLGSVTKTLSSDVLVSNGTTTILGTVTKTLSNDVLTASGSVGGIEGTLSVSLNNDTLVSSGTTTVVGTITRTLNNDTLNASGTTTITGSLAKTLNNDVLSASGFTGTPPVATAKLPLTGVGT